MKAKKTTKKPPATARRGKGAPRRDSPIPTAPVTTPINTAAVPVVRRVSARMSRRGLSAAQRMGAELTRYLRIHVKRPYGTRGEKAILDLAARVTQAAQLESKAFTDVIQANSLGFVDESLVRLRAKYEVNFEPVANASDAH